MALRLAVPDMISPSYFPLIAAVELGYCRDEGLDVKLDLVFPVDRAFGVMRDGGLDLIGGAAHAPLYAFKDWAGCKLVCALSQNTYWFLVVRRELAIERGDLGALRGLRIGAAPGPDAGLRVMLSDAGLDPDRDLDLGPVPPAAGASTSFGLRAAQALASGEVDGFWANGMGAEVAVRARTGTVVLDSRRGDGPPGSDGLTFAGLATTDRLIEERPDEVGAAVRAVIGAQRALIEDPELAAEAAQRLFPAQEAGLISELIRRDVPYYDPTIPAPKCRSLCEFARRTGLLDRAEVPYEEVVADRFYQEVGS